MLWLRLDGEGCLLFRHGVQPPASGATGAAALRWVPMPHLHLPGGRMQRVDFGASTTAPPQRRETEPDDHSATRDADSRDSRQAAA